MNAAAAAASSPSPVPGLLILLGCLILYFVPAVVAGARHVPHLGSVIVVNVFLGWTVIGWVVALAMACRSKPRPEPVTR